MVSRLWGAGSIQVYNYYNVSNRLSHYLTSPTMRWLIEGQRYTNDASWLKAHVSLVWLLDTTHEALIIASTYQYLITNYGNVETLALLLP